jgi:hypothetical protein
MKVGGHPNLMGLWGFKEFYMENEKNKNFSKSL